MKNLALIACFVALASTAYGYDERVERTETGISTAWTSPADVTVAGRELAEKGPIAGNFYAFSGTFASKDLTCDEFLAKTHQLISDWRLYPHMNLYALSSCRPAPNAKSSTDFIYAIDAWRPEAVAEVREFLKAHQGLQFQGQTLWFYAVNKLDVKTVLSLGILNANGGLRPIHSADAWSEYSGTDQWYPTNYKKGKIIAQTDLDVFLNWVGGTFGDDQRTPFREALVNSNFVQFSDFFKLHLSSGQQAEFWLGFGGNRKCGAQPCFTKAPRAGNAVFFISQ